MTEAETLKARNFGNRIKSLRERAELSRTELADRAGLHATTVASLEDGEQLPTDDTKEKLEKVFGFTLYLEEHKQVQVRVGGWEEDIDEVIAPLIEELWIAGIETTLSCQQDGYGLVWVAFPDADNALTFLNIVARLEGEEDKALYGRVTDYLPNAWRYDLHVDDLGEYLGPDGQTLEHTGDVDIVFSVSIRFPAFDLPTVLDRLREHNRALSRSVSTRDDP